MATTTSEFLRALIKSLNADVVLILAFALTAIPLLEIVNSLTSPMQQCGSIAVYATSASGQLLVTLLSLRALVTANRELYFYLIVISGKTAPTRPHDRQVAIVISGLVFVALIALYATLYFVLLPCLPIVQPDANLWSRTGSDFVTYLYFSSVTITTVGYGELNPAGHIGGELIAAAEAINGLIAFGVFTGALAGYIAAQNRATDTDEPL